MTDADKTRLFPVLARMGLTPAYIERKRAVARAAALDAECAVWADVIREAVQDSLPTPADSAFRKFTEATARGDPFTYAYEVGAPALADGERKAAYMCRLARWVLEQEDRPAVAANDGEET